MGQLVLLPDIEAFPSDAWIDQLNNPPRDRNAKWFTAWPVSGGQMCIQLDPTIFEVIDEVADQQIIDFCCSNEIHGFNPAATAIRSYLNSY